MIFGISCVAVAIAGLIYINKSNSVKLVENDLLMENVEALTQNDYPQGPRIQQASAKLRNVFVKALLWC